MACLTLLIEREEKKNGPDVRALIDLRQANGVFAGTPSWGEPESSDKIEPGWPAEPGGAEETEHRIPNYVPKNHPGSRFTNAGVKSVGPGRL
jgi:hypothetical protein